MALGARLVCITPETPDNSLSVVEKNDLTFDVLFDKGNVVAERYGLVFSLSEKLKETYRSFGIHLDKQNGDGTWALPIPATYVVRPDGAVIYHLADADYTVRLEPEKVVEALRTL